MNINKSFNNNKNNSELVFLKYFRRKNNIKQSVNSSMLQIS